MPAPEAEGRRCTPLPPVGRNAGGHLSDAKLAGDKALHDAHCGEECFLADHLRRAIKDVEARLRDAS